MNKKQKSSIIIASLASIAVAGSLIAGATYALFTSKSETNIAVTSGKVDVVATLEKVEIYSPTLIAADGLSVIDGANAASGDVFANGGKATFTDNSLTLDKVTPGDKVTFKINVTNYSNVETKYKTKLSLLDGDEILFNMLSLKDTSDTTGHEICSYETNWKDLDPTTDEANGTLTISDEYSLELPIAAGNIFQNRTCSIGFSVEAIQANASTTSFYEVSTEAEFNTAIRASGDKYILLLDDLTIVDNDDIWPLGNDVVVDLAGNTLTIPQCFEFDSGTTKNLTFRNGTLISNCTWDYNIFGWDDDGTNLTLDGVTLAFADSVSTSYAAICTNNSSVDKLNIFNSVIDGGIDIPYGTVNLNIKNSTLKNNNSSRTSLINVSNNSNPSNINIYSGTFDARSSSNNVNVFNIQASETTVNIYGGAFKVDGSGTSRLVSNLGSNEITNSHVNIYGATFNDVLIKNYVSDETAFHNEIAPSDSVTTENSKIYHLVEIEYGYKIYREYKTNS